MGYVPKSESGRTQISVCWLVGVYGVDGGVLIVLAVSMATMQRLLFSWSMVGEQGEGLILVSWGANTPHHILPGVGNEYTLNFYTKRR